MTVKPRTKEEIYQSMRNSLTGKIAKLSNFTERSFNYIWTQAFSEEVRELEVLATVSQMAGWVEYAGGPVTQGDLNNLGIDNDVTTEEVNDLMQEDFLDEYVKIVGVTRLPGSRATGVVDIGTQSAQTDIPSGTRVTTAPDSSGNTTDFLTTEDASTADGVTQVTDVPIQSAEIGQEYNIPAGTIVRFADPPIGVKSVNNPSSTTGGTERESNEDLRARAKRAIESSSLGGTTDGIKGYLRQNVEGVGEGDVIINEYFDPCPPYVNVIVDGGQTSEIEEAVDFSRPTGIRHNFIRPQITQLGFDIDLEGIDIDTTEVNNEVETFLLDLGIQQNFYEDELVRLIMNSDRNIVNIDDLGGIIERVTNERFIYSTDIDIAIADDGGTLTNETTQANDDVVANDMTLLPESPSVGDAYYFGEEEIFSEVEVNVSTAGSGTWDIVWEYYNGSSWVTPSNMSDGTGGFQNSGVGIVSWDIPGDWVATSIDNSDPIYYIRARLDSFSSISTQPLGKAADVTQPGYTLDFTYENTNGVITVEDDSGNTYNSGTDYQLVDKTGDGWQETVVWAGGTPDNGEPFSVDYDVTVPGQTSPPDEYTLNLVRDEEFHWNANYSESTTYVVEKDLYELDYVPFDGSTSITDENNNTYTEGTDYEIVDDSGNGFAQTVDWSHGGGTPNDNADFTVTYTQKLYETTYDLRDTPQGLIRDGSGDTYDEDTEYVTADYSGDGEIDSIHWTTNPSSIGEAEEFYFTYLTEGDKNFGSREKSDPGTINVNVI